MSDCSNHKKEVAGISDMKVLAEMIGDLHYESLHEFISNLYRKLEKDSERDFKNNKINLSKALSIASKYIGNASEFTYEAWQISKPFMEDKTTLK